jgi:prepilin-type processing-associated H-X9-DG protein
MDASVSSYMEAIWKKAKSPKKLDSFFVSFYTPQRIKIKTSRVRRPSESIAFLDAGRWIRSSSKRHFGIPDADGDGVADIPAKPKKPRDDNFRVHADGTQMAFFDGHVERVHYRKLWAYDSAGKLTHRYWYPE